MTKPIMITVEERHHSFPGAEEGFWTDWRWQHRRMVRLPEEAAALFPSRAGCLYEWRKTHEVYPMAATPYYLSLADHADALDPVLAQVLPSRDEIGDGVAESEDPLLEEAMSPVPGMVRRYRDRALLMVTHHCFVHCRHCNRKRFWRTGDGEISPEGIEEAVEYLRGKKEIREVILSGGDPLTLADDRLDGILSLLRRVPHLEVIRLGTRAPVVLPWRIDRGLTAILEKHGPIWVNTHFNHPREVTAEAAEACLRLLKAGVPVNNQTVLLKGINDTAEVMTELCRALQRIRVRPYYLFQCDPVRGAGHFRTSLSTGIGIIGAMRKTVGGLCLPSFVVDLPGGGGKVPLQPDNLIPPGEKHFIDD